MESSQSSVYIDIFIGLFETTGKNERLCVQTVINMKDVSVEKELMSSPGWNRNVLD